MNSILEHTKPSVIVVDADIMGGEPVFRGTRVPIASLFEHLEGGSSLTEYLDWFPTVTEQVAVDVMMAPQDLRAMLEL
jgi:uncharacterized protein (DUF433 family)